MKRAIFLLAVIGALSYVASRLTEQTEGSLRDRASGAAASVRERGPGVIQAVASGIEKAGEATEAGAQTLRRRIHAQDEEGASPGSA